MFILSPTVPFSSLLFNKLTSPYSMSLSACFSINEIFNKCTEIGNGNQYAYACKLKYLSNVQVHMRIGNMESFDLIQLKEMRD